MNRGHFFTEEHRRAQAVSQSVTQKPWSGTYFSVVLLFLEADEEEVVCGGGVGLGFIQVNTMHLVVDPLQEAMMKMLPYFVENAVLTQSEINRM